MSARACAKASGIAVAPMQFEEIADRKGIGPQIALRVPRRRRKAGAAGEFGHQAGGNLCGAVGVHGVLPDDCGAPSGRVS